MNASTRARIERHIDKVIDPPHWLWTAHLTKRGGCARIGWEDGGRNYSVSVHRFMLEESLGRGLLAPGMMACHRRECPHSHCINPACLYEGTAQQNSDDMVALGHHTVGERNNSRKRPESMAWGLKNGSATVSDDVVAEAVARVAAGESQRAVARSVGVHWMSVHDWVHGRKRAYAAALRGAK